jgi:hypothetical protein
MGVAVEAKCAFLTWVTLFFLQFSKALERAGATVLVDTGTRPEKCHLGRTGPAFIIGEHREFLPAGQKERQCQRDIQ